MLFEKDSFVQRLAGDEEAARALMPACLADVDRQVNALCSCGMPFDYKTLLLKSHQLKGAAANLSMVELSRLANDLHSHAILEDARLCAEALSRIGMLWPQIKRKVEDAFEFHTAG
jgi:HPt (histidine-containing phosphotransfer) domain-containing protein